LGGPSSLVGAGLDELGPLGGMNDSSKYDIRDSYLNFYGNDDASNPYLNLANPSYYTDVLNFSTAFSDTNAPVFLSLNIQSLNSKFNSLECLLSDLYAKNINVAVIALQELWHIPSPDLFQLNDFKFYYSARKNGRGGGCWLLCQKLLLMQDQ